MMSFFNDIVNFYRSLVSKIFRVALVSFGTNFTSATRKFERRKETVHRPKNLSPLFHANLKPKQQGSWAPLYRMTLFLITLVLLTFSLLVMGNQGEDMRANIINGTERCFHYIPETKMFLMICTVLHWQENGYDAATHISLSANETFDGAANEGGHREKFIINLSGVVGFGGLITVKDEDVATFAEAPMIRNVHVKNGTTADSGGFIVQQAQKYFSVVSCSSTGTISVRAGGICGYLCGYMDGKIDISNSHSTGAIGPDAGGITGEKAGQSGGLVRITRCHSSGEIQGENSGGIAGKKIGRNSGQAYITRSYSIGKISGKAAGSIVGTDAGTDGYVQIRECFSTGNINSDWSSGILGKHAASNNGEVHVVNCYARGDIDGRWAAGIGGFNVGGKHVYGDVYINNSYSSGTVNEENAGSIIGSIHPGFNGKTVRIIYSVYNPSQPIVGANGGNGETLGNSGNLNRIQNQLYHSDGMRRWDNETWVPGDPLLILRFQLPPTPSVTASVTTTPSSSTTTTGRRR